MTRFKFFAAVLGAAGLARAQQSGTILKQGALKGQPLFEPEWKHGTKRNGQCPTCGTEAPPWYNPPSCFGTNGPMPCGPNEKVVRCSRCSAAFWQDAEAK